jgi:hypothetical protein
MPIPFARDWYYFTLFRRHPEFIVILAGNRGISMTREIQNIP